MTIRHVNRGRAPARFRVVNGKPTNRRTKKHQKALRDQRRLDRRRQEAAVRSLVHSFDPRDHEIEPTSATQLFDGDVVDTDDDPFDESERARLELEELMGAVPVFSRREAGMHLGVPMTTYVISAS